MQPLTTGQNDSPASPLRGRTVVVTRPKERSGTLSSCLRALGAEVLECPCIETVVREDLAALRQALMQHWDWAAFTSPTGVHLTVQALQRIGLDLHALSGMRLAAVGSGTAEALLPYGLAADLVPGQFDGAHLAEALLPMLTPGSRVLILRGASGNSALPSRLQAAGMETADIPVYETVINPQGTGLLRPRLAAGTVDLAAFTSASAVRGFAQAAQGCDLSGIPAACIGPQTAQEARAHGMCVKIAKKAAIEDLICCILEEFTDV